MLHRVCVLRHRAPHVVLGVPYHASWDDVKAAFQRLAKEHHPDTNQGAGNTAAKTEKFAAVLDAYAALKRQKKDAKRWSDARRGGGVASPPASSSASTATTSAWASMNTAGGAGYAGGQEASSVDARRWQDMTGAAAGGAASASTPERAKAELTPEQRERMEKMAAALKSWRGNQAGRRREGAQGDVGVDDGTTRQTATPSSSASINAPITPRRGWGTMYPKDSVVSKPQRTPNRGWRVRPRPPPPGAPDTPDRSAGAPQGTSTSAADAAEDAHDDGGGAGSSGNDGDATAPTPSPSACFLCKKTLVVPVRIALGVGGQRGTDGAAGKDEAAAEVPTPTTERGVACMHCARDALGLMGVTRQRQLPPLPKPLPPPLESSYTIDFDLAARLDARFGDVTCIRRCGWRGPRAAYMEHIKRCGTKSQIKPQNVPRR